MINSAEDNAGLDLRVPYGQEGPDAIEGIAGIIGVTVNGVSEEVETDVTPHPRHVRVFDEASRRWRTLDPWRDNTN